MNMAKEQTDKLVKLQIDLFYELEELRLALTKERKRFISKSVVIKILMENYKAKKA